VTVGAGGRKEEVDEWALCFGGATEVLLDSRICSTLFNIILVNEIVIKSKLTASDWLGHPCHSQPCPWLLAGQPSS
jgi:hypothetical protein